MTPAVIFLVFNRPTLTRRVFESIRAARPPQLFVVADGPRVDRVGESEKCAEVRRLIEEGIDWPCELVRDYSDINLGCGKRVATGITNAFRRVEEAIILEDDCLPDPTFFPFCEELLGRYRNEITVALIAGCSFQAPSEASDRPSYYFSRYPHCWGWATWRRAWHFYDFEMRLWRGNRRWMKRMFKTSAERRWWNYNFAGTYSGLIDTWDFQWTLAVFSRGWSGIWPYHNLVCNLGFGPDATHTREVSGPSAALPVFAMKFPLVHPPNLGRDVAADEHTSRLFFRMPGIGRRLIGRLYRILRL